MNNKDFKHELLVWADNVIKAQKQFDESGRFRADIWYRPESDDKSRSSNP
jgi:hypothetical protein